MKKLVLLLTAVLLTAISANVFAQTNTGILPSVGSTHEYYVNSTDGTSQDLGDVNNTFIWWVSTDATDLTNQISDGTEFTVESGTYGGTGGVNNFKIELTWNPASITSPTATIYYLVVQEFDTDGNACSNTKAIAIQPQNNFELLFVALDESDAASDDPSRCAPDIALTASGTTITYDYGVGEYIFKLTALDIYSGWSFDNSWTNVLGDASPTIEYQVGGTGGSWSAITSTVSVSGNSAGTEDVFVRVTVDNGDTDSTAEEGTTAQTMELTLSNVEDAGGNAAVKISNNDGDDITSSPVQTQTVNARPATSTIGYN